jgi:VIT1/CCC1 family predicted Fe2+/Mn2+ transporter
MYMRSRADQPERALPRLRRISFGTTAAVVTSMALIVGLDAATVSRATIAATLLILALADNLTDSLGIHVYQESERLAQRDAFRTTVANFLTRLLVSLSFIALLFLAPAPLSTYAAVVWGLALLSVLTFLLARARNARPGPEICRHCAVAVAVIALTRLIGAGIPHWFGLT